MVSDQSMNNETLYTPKDVAEKIDVAPNMVYVYSKEFEEYLEEYTRLTKEKNGHRRYTEEGLAVFYEIRRMLDQPGYTYQRVHEEFRRRKEQQLGGPAGVVQYQQLRKLEQLYGADGEIVKQMFSLAHAVGELAMKNSSLELQNKQLMDRLDQQNQFVLEISKSNSELLAKTNVLVESFGELAQKSDGLEEQNNRLIKIIEGQGKSIDLLEKGIGELSEDLPNKIGELSQKSDGIEELNAKLIRIVEGQGKNIASLEKGIGELSEDLPNKIRVDEARRELEEIEKSGKVGFFDRLFGRRNVDSEARRKERCRQIIEADRNAIKKVGPEVKISYSSSGTDSMNVNNPEKKEK